MGNYGKSHLLKEVGKLVKFSNGYCTFLLANNEKIIFEEIDNRVYRKFDFNSKEIINKNFEISYYEILEDFLDEDYVIYRIDDLKLI